MLSHARFISKTFRRISSTDSSRELRWRPFGPPAGQRHGQDQIIMVDVAPDAERLVGGRGDLHLELLEFADQCGGLG